ncbi:TnsD family Tn7-like transposition protein [Myxosarcina sp. GI1]|uniref:TnsD family Tn7-like transposition protein n=1 Tax=Myxosarcina sp. GI1 TaxID=1541065 RepID=UPI003526FB69
MERGYTNTTGRVKQEKLIDDFLYFYDTEFLEVIDSTVAYEDKSNWLFQIVRKPRKIFHLFGYLVVEEIFSPRQDNLRALYEPR